MKKIYGLIVFVIIILSLSSCDDFMDVHKEYVEGGEIVYAPKPDSVSFIAGDNRILFNCRTYNAPNVHTIDVYWNNGLDSLIIPVTMATGYDSISVLLDNMSEKSYTFDVRTTDSFGHKSLYMTGFGTSYGEIYKSTLTDRRVKNVTLSDKGATIDMYSSPSGLVRTEIRYLKADGSKTIVNMPSADYTIELLDAKAASFLEYRSLFLPEKACIDTFATAWAKYETPLPDEFMYNRSSWEVLSVSDEASDGGGMATLIDDKLDTFWHSAWEGGDAPFPHWAVIDMKEPKAISRLELYRRAGNKDTKSIEIYVSDQPDGSTNDWVKIGSGEFTDNDKISISIPESVDARKGQYLRLLLPDSNRNTYTAVAEVYAYGK